ncbi:MAG: hypothetical protein WCL32_19020 [Planctomycetota bacterium]
MADQFRLIDIQTPRAKWSFEEDEEKDSQREENGRDEGSSDSLDPQRSATIFIDNDSDWNLTLHRGEKDHIAIKE